MHWWTTSALVVMVLAVGFWGENPSGVAHASEAGAPDALVPLGAMPASRSSTESALAARDWFPSPGPSSPLASRQASRQVKGGGGSGHAPVGLIDDSSGSLGPARTPEGSASAPRSPRASDGEERHYHPTGELAANGRVEGDRREGTWQFWYPDGTPQASRVYTAGQLDGPFRAWHGGGEVSVSGAYQGGLRHGPWIRRFTDGSPMELGAYDRGLREGQWYFYDERGRPVGRTGHYSQGKQVQ